jgi:hypothetical protein
VIDFDAIAVERIDVDLDAVAGQVRRGFEEAFLQQEGGIAAHEAGNTIEEDAPQIGGRGQLADLFNVALPAQQWSVVRRGREQRGMLVAMIDGLGQCQSCSFSCLVESSALGSREARNCSRTCRVPRADKAACER